MCANMSSQVEVGVVSKVDWCGLVAGGCVVNDQLVVLCQLVGDSDCHMTRVVLLPIWAVIGQLECVSLHTAAPYTL